MEKNNEYGQELLTLNDKKSDGNLNSNSGNTTKDENDLELELDEYDTKCGLGYSPKWLQTLASKKSYVFVFGLLGLYETVLGTYYIGTISTMEKRFKFPSAISGVLTSAWDVGTMFASLIVAYFGSAGHKTRWISFGILIAASSCFLRYLPQFIYGPGDDALLNSSMNNSSPIENLCNKSSPITENCSFNSEGTVAFTILIVSLLLLGAGTSPYFTLGAAYLDDNILKNKFPFLFSVVVCVRFLGPTLGFLLSSYTLSFYVDPNSKPPFGEDDPRWIGAWYSGWNPLGYFGIIIAFLMAHFPKMLPREAERRKSAKIKDNQNKTRSFKDFKETVWRLSKNRVFMLNTFSSTLGLLGVMGFWLFLPKYMETQFRKTASEANLITGGIGLVSTAVGVVSSGAIISKFKPRATYLAAWNVFTETIDVMIYIAFAYLGCYKADIHGRYNEDYTWNLITDCNAGCGCNPSMAYSPVCSMDKSITFYSSCHAGCTSWYMSNETKIYENCRCIDNGLGRATAGACPIQCDNDFIIFLILLCVMEFLSATGRSGNTIIQYRAVNPDDKSISIAITAVVFCAVAFIPGPVIHGMLLDISCNVWGMTCGKTGNCWLYDGQKMRYLLNFAAAGMMVVAVVLDIGVLLNVSKLKIYDEEVDKTAEKQNKEPFLAKLRKMHTLMVNSQ